MPDRPMIKSTGCPRQNSMSQWRVWFRGPYRRRASLHDMPSPQYRHHVRVRRNESEHNSITKGIVVVAQPPRPSRFRSRSKTYASKCGNLLAHGLASHKADKKRSLYSAKASYRSNLQASSLCCLPDRQGKETNRRRSRYRQRHLKKGLLARRKIMREEDQELPRRQRCLQIEQIWCGSCRSGA